MALKQFRTLDEQLEIMRNKGLTINDEQKAKEILFRENYFFINGYRFPFMLSTKDRKFIEGTTFDELYALFQFDRKLRNIMFKHLLIVENNLKSIISYQLSKKYGIKEKDYLKPSNFTQDTKKVMQVNDVINKMKRQIRVNGRQHTATFHYLSNYGYIPLWVLVKVLSFGIISELFLILKVEDQQAISDVYHLRVETLATYLPILSNYRNLCAHEDILFDHKTQRLIPDTEYHEDLDIPKVEEEYIYGKDDLFALMIILKQMLREEEFVDLVNEVSYEIDRLEGSLKSIPIAKILNRIGYPLNWIEIKNM